MAGRRPAVPPRVAEVIRHLSPDIKREVRSALRVLSADPAAGQPLQGELRGLWKYRVRRFRIIYEVHRPGKIVSIIAIGHRRSIYEEVGQFFRHRE